MKVTRGEFLAACGAGVLGTVIDASELEGATADAIDTTRALRPPAPDLFGGQVGTVFQLDAEGGSQPVTLIEVRDRSVEWRVEQVSALFRGAAALTLPDGTYAFHHPALGRLELFVVSLGPAGASGPHVHYEACISRFRSV